MFSFFISWNKIAPFKFLSGEYMELHQLTIHELQKLIQNGEVSSTQITRSVFSRIDEVEERIHSYIRLMKDEALAAAARADEDIKTGTSVR